MIRYRSVQDYADERGGAECRCCPRLADVISIVRDRVMEDRLSDERIASYRQDIADYLLSRRGKTASSQTRLRKSIDGLNEKFSRADSRVMDAPDDMLPMLYKKIRELRDQKQSAEAQLAAELRLSSVTETAIAADCQTYERELLRIREELASDDTAVVRNALERIIVRIELFSKPVIKRLPGMSPRTKRVLCEVRVHYREVLDVLQVAHRVESVRCSFAETTASTAVPANCNFANTDCGR